MQHLHGVVQGENVSQCFQHRMHSCLLGGAAHEGSSQQLLPLRNCVVLLRGDSEDETLGDSLVVPLLVRPQLVHESATAELDVLLAEGLHLVLQSDYLQPAMQTQVCSGASQDACGASACRGTIS